MRTCLIFAALLTPVTPAHGRTLELPIRSARSPLTQAPAFVGDVLEIQLHPSAAHAAFALAARRPVGKSLRPPMTPSGRIERLGIPALDRVAAELGGVWFEYEFVGETPPPAPSREADYTSFLVAHLPDGVELASALDRFAALDDVVRADPIAIMPVNAAPDDSLWSESWWLYQYTRRDLHALEAWNVTTGDTSIVVAIIDTGILRLHPDLGGTDGGPGQLWTNWAEQGGTPGVDDDGNGFVDDTWGWDFVAQSFGNGTEPGEDWSDQDNDPNDFAGHGTINAGLIGAIANNHIGGTGLAWKVRLMALRAGWSSLADPLGEVEMLWAAQAFRYATRMGATVINCSFASSPTAGLEAAISGATHAGIVVVSAAGNYGSSHYIASRSDVIAVTASNAIDEIPAFANLGDYVTLAAPGVAMASTWVKHLGTDSLSQRSPAYADNLNGTSYAAPMVTGAVALIQAERHAQGLRPLLPLGMAMRLAETSDDISSTNPGIVGYGAGRLNLERAVTSGPTSVLIRAGARTVGPAVLLPAGGVSQSVAYATSDQKLLILDPTLGDTLQLRDLPGPPAGGVAGADLGGGHGFGIFIGLANGKVAGLDAGGDPVPGWPVSPIGAVLPMGAGPALADLDGDGVLEVVCGSQDGRVYAWHADGTTVSGFPVTATGPVIAPVALASLDGQPGAQVIALDNHGSLHAWRGNGAELPGWPVALYQAGVGPVVTRPAGAASPIVVAGAGHTIYVVTPGGASTAVRVLSGAIAQDLALGDFDGDGTEEVMVATTQPDQLEIVDLDGGGRPLVGWPHAMPTPALGPPVLGHLKSGPGPEALCMLGSGLLALSDSAVAIRGFPKPGAAGSSPSLAELYGDGATEVLAGAGDDSAIFIYDAGAGSWSNTPQPWPTPRGNDARTASHAGVAPAGADSIPPARISDLTVVTLTTQVVSVSWTAPADSGATGRAARYDLRQAAFPITSGNFFAARPVTGVPDPASPGTRQNVTVNGLAEGDTIWFLMRSRDATYNLSAFSNLALGVTLSIPPSPIADLHTESKGDTTVTLAWTATGDDSSFGRATRYRIAASDQPITEASFDAIAPWGEVGSTTSAGGTERVTLHGPEREQRLWFALRAYDAAGNRSRVSNGDSVLFGLPLPPVDFTLVNKSDSTVTVYWTMPNQGPPAVPLAGVSLRGALAPLTPSNFAAAPIARELTFTATGGERESLRVSGLAASTRYWFALEARDRDGYGSRLSLQVIAMTGHLTALTDLTLIAKTDSSIMLRWTVHAADGAGEIPAVGFPLSWAPYPIDTLNFGSAPFYLWVPLDVSPGSSQSLVLNNDHHGTRYWLAMRSIDSDGYQSTISNVISAVIGLTARVVDLAVTWRTDSSVVLRWTSSSSGSLAPAGFSVRGATAPIDPASFNHAPVARGIPARMSFGEPETLEVEGLERGRRYWFALEARDSDGVSSPLSNLASALTRGAAAVTDLRVLERRGHSVALGWTAAVADSAATPPAHYLVAGALTSFDHDSFERAPLKVELDARAARGHPETVRLDSLTSGTRYWFAVQVLDSDGLVSELSNQVLTTTTAGGLLDQRVGVALACAGQPSRLPVTLFWQGAAEAYGKPQRIRFYDLSGRLLRTLEVGTSEGGEVKWDGRDQDGSLVPAGLYFARLISGSFHAQTRVVLLP